MSEVTVTLTRLEVEHFLEDAPRDNGHDYLLDDRCLYCAPLIRKMKAAYTEQGSPEVCADCKGDGESWTEYGGVCPTCHGTGTVETGPQTSDEDAGTGNGPVSGGDDLDEALDAYREANE